MKTKQFKLTILCLLIAVSTSFAEGFKVQKETSSVKWNGKKVSGEHYGQISIKNGEFVVENGKIVGGTFVVDMNTITCEDLDGEWNKKLVDHLKSDDFFGVESYPTSKLVLKDVNHQSGNSHTFEGHLTIKGKTHPIRFTADVDMEKNKIVANGKLVIDRTQYNIRYGSGKFFQNLGDRMIHDEFTLEYNITAKK